MIWLTDALVGDNPIDVNASAFVSCGGTPVSLHIVAVLAN